MAKQKEITHQEWDYRLTLRKKSPPPNFLMKGQVKVFCTCSKHLNEGHSITCSVDVWVWMWVCT